MPGVDTSSACGSRSAPSAPLPAFLSTTRVIEAAGGSSCAIKVTDLGVKAPYDEDNEVLSRQAADGPGGTKGTSQQDPPMEHRSLCSPSRGWWSQALNRGWCPPAWLHVL